MGWLSKLVRPTPTADRFPHDVPSLEETLPAEVAGRPMVRWSATGDMFWKLLGGDRTRTYYADALASLGGSADEVAMAVAGRANAKQDPPYIIWVVDFGKIRGESLFHQAPSSLAMQVNSVDSNQGENWFDRNVAGKNVLWGHSGMVRQDDHHRGKPVVYVSGSAIFAVIAEDDAWIEEVLSRLPVSDSDK